MSATSPKWSERGGKLGIPAGAVRLKGFTAKAVAKLQAKRKAKKEVPQQLAAE